MSQIRKARNSIYKRVALGAAFVMSAGFTAALAGCGSTTSTSALPSPIATNPYTNGYGAPTTTGSTSSGSSTSTDTSFTPSMTYSFALYGTGSGQETYTTPAIQTDSLLKIRITPDAAGNVSIPGGTYSNFQASYACAGFTLTALGQSTATDPLGVNGGVSFCQNGSQVIDFSGRLGQGHGPVTVTVSQPKYDYYCQLWYAGLIAGSYYMYCPLHTVYKTHNVNGHIEIEVNGSSN